MLTEICAEIKNYFTYECDKHFGNFAIIDGQITPFFELPTNYIRITGSRLNNGVHVRVTDGWGLSDEPLFHGSVWIMSLPPDFIALAAEIEAWQDKYGGISSENMSPFQSESFGGYSYSKGSTGNSYGAVSSSVPTWQSTFASRLKIYRRILI